MKKSSLKERLSYQFDKIMTRGTVSLVALLFLITLIVVVIVGFIVSVFFNKISFLKAIWLSFNHTLDSGMLGGDEGSILYLFFMVIATICGLFITSLLIGILGSGIEAKFAELRKGKSKVLENNHTVILGYNDNLFPILSELFIANASVKKPCIVIVGNEEKEIMEEAIQAHFPDRHNTNIICRSGDTSDIADLAKCSIETCHSVIINEPDDFMVIKSIIAATSFIKKTKDCKAFIVATIQDKRNVEVAKIAGEGYAEILYFKSTIAKIIAHTCHQPGMSNVFLDLFDFSGDEIYIEEKPSLYNKKMQDIIGLFENAAVIGIERNGVAKLNPSSNTTYQQGDKLILIAEDDNVATPLSTQPVTDVSLIQKSKTNLVVTSHEKILFLGYNLLLPEILEELDHYLDSTTLIQIAMDELYTPEIEKKLQDTCQNANVEIQQVNIFDHDYLQQIAADANHIVLLSNLDKEAEIADSETLMLLLHLRKIAQQNNCHFSITSEMINIRNQQLAKVAKVNDFVISSNITGLMVAQLSQNRALFSVFEDLLDDAGAEIYMKPVSRYLELGKETDFYTAAQAVSLKNETLIGYKKANSLSDIKIKLNPAKSAKMTFSEADRFIVISEEN